jgi:hypothetical protein
VTEPALLLISCGAQEPDSVAITPISEPRPPMIEQAQNTAGWAIRRAWNWAWKRRRMIRMSTKRITMEMHQMTVTAAWSTS